MRRTLGRESMIGIVSLVTAALASPARVLGQSDLSAQLLADMCAAMDESFRGTLEYECVKTRPPDAGALLLHNDLATRDALVTGNGAVDAANAQRFEADRADL